MEAAQPRHWAVPIAQKPRSGKYVLRLGLGSILYSPLLAHFLSLTDVGKRAICQYPTSSLFFPNATSLFKGSAEEAMKWWLRSLAVNHAKLRPFSGFAGFSTKGLQLDGVKNIVAIASGKGGVGKSTTAVNLAVALAKKCQLKVGVLDADVYGPSVPTMMNLHGEPEVTADQKIVPFQNYGVKCMSIGFLVPKDSPLVWRGPMVASALEKLSRGVDWGNLDILVVDMPPGTGDTQITISQRLQLTGVLIVTTPQDVALIDARRGVTMFSKVEVPILGIIENMSCFKCPNCGHPSYIFGNGGARKTADEMCLDYLGEIPLEVDIVKASDEGVPLVISAPDSSVTKGYNDLAQKLMDKIGKLTNEQLRPEISL